MKKETTVSLHVPVDGQVPGLIGRDVVLELDVLDEVPGVDLVLQVGVVGGVVLGAVGLGAVAVQIEVGILFVTTAGLSGKG